MAGPKSTVVSDKWSLDDVTVSSSIDGDITQGGRTKRSEDDLRDPEVIVDSTALNVPDHYENSPANATMDARNYSSVERAVVFKDGVASKSPSPVIDYDSLCEFL